MQTLTFQVWEITNDDETIRIDFEIFKSGNVSMGISKDKNYISLDGEQITKLKNILDSTRIM